MYKRQERRRALIAEIRQEIEDGEDEHSVALRDQFDDLDPVSYTHLRAHETVLDLVCRLLLEKKNPHLNTILSMFSAHSVFVLLLAPHVH